MTSYLILLHDTSKLIWIIYLISDQRNLYAFSLLAKYLLSALSNAYLAEGNKNDLGLAWRYFCCSYKACEKVLMSPEVSKTGRRIGEMKKLWVYESDNVRWWESWWKCWSYFIQDYSACPDHSPQLQPNKLMQYHSLTKWSSSLKVWLQVLHSRIPDNRLDVTQQNCRQGSNSQFLCKFINGCNWTNLEIFFFLSSSPATHRWASLYPLASPPTSLYPSLPMVLPLLPPHAKERGMLRGKNILTTIHKGREWHLINLVSI